MRKISLLVFALSIYSLLYGQSFQNGDFEGLSARLQEPPIGWRNVPENDFSCLASSKPGTTSDLISSSGPKLSTGILGNPSSGLTAVTGLFGTPTKNSNRLIFHEGIMQEVSGFSLGCQYDIDFYQSVVKQVNALDSSGSWNVYIDNTLLGTSNPTKSTLMYNDPNLIWEKRTFSFIATKSSYLIKFLPQDDDPIFSGLEFLRMGLDDVSINLANDVLTEDNFLGDDIILCELDSLELDAFHDKARYQWQDGSDKSDLIVTKSGKYWVEVTLNCHKIVDTIDVIFIPLPRPFLPEKIEICEAELLVLEAQKYPNATYKWQDGSIGSSYIVKNEGIHWVEIKNECGKIRDSVEVKYLKPPQVDLGDDLLLCEGEIIELVATSSATQYLWQDGSFNNSLEVTKEGIYWVEVSNRCGAARDSINIDFVEAPMINLGPDQFLCEGETLILDATTSDVNYLWQDGSNNPTFEVTKSGTYWVELSNGCESVIDSVIIEISDQPIIDLGVDQLACEGDLITIELNIFNADYLWQDGSKDNKFVVNKSGIYWVEVTNKCGTTRDSIIIDYNDAPFVNLGPDRTFCEDVLFILDPLVFGVDYLWQDGSVDSTFSVTESGIYWVELSNECGSVRDSIVVDYLSLPVVDLGEDILLCEGETIELVVASKDSEYVWQDGSKSDKFEVSKSGIYWVEVTNSCGENRDSIEVVFVSPPMIDIGSDKTLCEGDSLNLIAFFQNSNYLWQDGSIDSKYVITRSGQYWVEVTNACGSVRDTVNMEFIPLPKINLGPDVILCEGETLNLGAYFEGASYLWQDGSINSEFEVTKQGVYWIEVSTKCGTIIDSIEVIYEDRPAIDLGSDTTLCEGAIIQLETVLLNATAKWQDGSEQTTYTVKEEGQYWVEVKNACGSDRDSVLINYIEIPTVDLGEDQYVCKDDILVLTLNEITGDLIWQDGSTGDSLEVKDEGLYWVKSKNQCGEDYDSIFIDFIQKPYVDLGHDLEICDEDEITLNVQFDGATYLWQDGSVDEIFEVTDQNEIWVNISNECGIVSDSIKIIHGNCNCSIYIPNTFSPNGDGINDHISPLSDCDLDQYDFQIYDRWGEKIFHTKNHNEKWNGEFSNGISPPGVYAYIFTYKQRNNENKVIIGSLTLLR